MENQLFQGNQGSSILNHGSPNGEPTVSGEQRSFNSVSWVSKWRTNCFKGTKTLQFQIMDLQMENQLLQWNPAASGSPCWRSSTIVNKYRFGIMDLQMENQLVQGNQEASILYHGSPNGEPTVTREPSSVRLSMLEIHYFSE